MALSAGVTSTPSLGSVSDFVDGHSGVCSGGLIGIPVFLKGLALPLSLCLVYTSSSPSLSSSFSSLVSLLFLAQCRETLSPTEKINTDLRR